jgi:hypothetical protein
MNSHNVTIKSVEFSGRGNVLEITNYGLSESAFDLEYNSSNFYNEQSIIKEIYKLHQDNLNIPIERIAWMYISEFLDYNNPVTEKEWLHNTVIMMNSAGGGQCDDLATVLAFIWKGLGFKSRVWSLNGHVVPEVLVAEKWRMYDPSFQVYYSNCDEEVIGVSELSDNPSFILNNSKVMGNANIFSKVFSNSLYLTRIYSTKHDNYVNAWYDNKTDKKSRQFILPPNTAFSFPYRDGTHLYAGGDFPNNYYAIASIPDNAFGKLNVPLIIFSIKGKGEILINRKSYSLGTEELTAFFDNTDTLITQIEFIGNNKNVTVQYLLNEKLLKEKTTVSIKGKNIQKTVLTEHRKDTSDAKYTSIDSVIEYHFQNYNRNIFELRNTIKLSPELSTKENLKKKIEKFVEADNKLSKEEKEKKIQLIHSRTDSIENIFAGNSEVLFNKFMPDEVLVFYISYAEQLNMQQLKQIIR